MQGVGFSHHHDQHCGSVHSEDVDKCSVNSQSAQCAQSQCTVCTVTMHGVHSHAEKCFSQCAVAASSLNFKLSSVLGARLLTFSLQASGLILLLALKLA